MDLRDTFGPYLTELIDVLKERRYIFEIPDIDAPIEDIFSAVARTANAYGHMARLAGIARANAKLAKGDYERKFKRARSVGANEAQRSANAIEESKEEHIRMTTAEALAEAAEGWENALRVASESARKILDKVQAMQIATSRESHGAYQSSDFQPF